MASCPPPIYQVRDAWPNEAMCPVSAGLEWSLRQWRRRGLVRYAEGASVVEFVLPERLDLVSTDVSVKGGVKPEQQLSARNTLDRLGGTGVGYCIISFNQASCTVMCCAVLRCAVLCCAVSFWDHSCGGSSPSLPPSLLSCPFQQVHTTLPLSCLFLAI